MKRSYLVEHAHKALRSHDRQGVVRLLESVNLTLLEREIIKRSELDGTDLETICNTLKYWRGKNICSYVYCQKVKHTGMKKIGLYLQYV
jgi:hypothetical protein